MNVRYCLSSCTTLLLLLGTINLSAVRRSGESRKNWHDITFKNETDMDLVARNSKLPKRGEVKFAVEPGVEIQLRDAQQRVQPTSVIAAGSYRFKVRREGSGSNQRLVAEQY